MKGLGLASLPTACEPLEHPGPAVALVGDEGLQYREGRGHVSQCRAIQLGPAEQGRGSCETRRLGQEPAHFELGVDATLQLSDYFQDRAVADADRGVGLLHAAPANGPASSGFEPGTRQVARLPCSQPHRARSLAATPQ